MWVGQACFPTGPVQSGGSQENPTFHWKPGYAGAPVDPPSTPAAVLPLPHDSGWGAQSIPYRRLTSRAGLGCLSQETPSHSCTDLARMRHLP